MDESQLPDEIVSAYKPISIDEEMKSSYLEYAMSVIVGRALPDVRDGLKPVHRRILYAMYDAGYTSGRPYKKCARIVGDVLGRYHPHGDSAVYDSLVRMAQDFSLRYPLIDGQGNYGSVDGDNAAAMRYTEARMAPISMELLADIEKETVDFAPNFDESLQEPTVLPSRLPNLLLNGTSGIAVGMATNIPPHHLGELVDGICAIVDNPEIDIMDLCTLIKGPDFPTGGIICGRRGIVEGYTTGRGIITVRGKTHIEESSKKNKKAIIVTEIPYMVNKANLIIKIAELVNDKKIPDIADLRDESDRKGMRIYIELKRDAQAEVVLNQLYKHTQLQTSFGINMVALVNGIPRTLNIKEILVHYIAHRKVIIRRRTEFDLRAAEARQHILEGLRIALQNIDAVIALIKKAPNVDEARSGLMTKFKLSEKQSVAILEMRLQRLTGLERDKIEDEFQKLLVTISDLKDILSNDGRILGIIKTEHLEIKDKYSDKRRTELGGELEVFDIEDLIPDEQVAVLLTNKGFVKRMPVSLFRSQLRGGRGINGMVTREEDIIDQLMVSSTHDFLLCFTSVGRVFKMKVYQIPEASRQSKGLSLSHLLEFGENEHLTTVIPVRSFDTDDYLMMTTQKGVIKKSAVRDFIHFKNRPIIAIDLDEGDSLRWVKKTHGKNHIIMVTSQGMCIRFSEEQIRAMGRTARGVRGITTRPKDYLVSMDIIEPESKSILLLITRYGYGKTIRIDEFKTQKRGGIGVRSLKFRTSLKGEQVQDALIAHKVDELMIVTKNGTLCRQSIQNISTQRRESQGVRIIKLDSDDRVVAFARLMEEIDEAPSADQKAE
jgi:DNA gyrase subunit A